MRTEASKTGKTMKTKTNCPESTAGMARTQLAAMESALLADELTKKRISDPSRNRFSKTSTSGYS